MPYPRTCVLSWVVIFFCLLALARLPRMPNNRLRARRRRT